VVLNYIAVIKILKKYDVCTKQDTCSLYLSTLYEEPFMTGETLGILLVRSEQITEKLVRRKKINDAKFLCVLCKKSLQRPVQLKCSHRVCFKCLTAVLTLHCFNLVITIVITVITITIVTIITRCCRRRCAVRNAPTPRPIWTLRT
jgi:hypothetical protein